MKNTLSTSEMTNTVPSTRVCPCCGNSRVPTEVYVKWSFSITRCPMCGLGQTEVDADFESKSLYDESYFNGERKDGYADYRGSENVLDKEFASAVCWLRKNGVSNGDLLEIGCAYGFFLKAATPYFNVQGIEVAADAVKFCQTRGLSVSDESLETVLTARTKKLDAVVMLDVIEHLDDLPGVFSSLRDAVRPGGALMLTTGDWGSIAAKLMGRYWRLMTPPQHLSFFTKMSMEKLLLRHGFKLKICERPWKMVPLSLIVYQVLNRMGFRKKYTWLPTIGIPANLFDTMRVLAIRENS